MRKRLDCRGEPSRVLFVFTSALLLGSSSIILSYLVSTSAVSKIEEIIASGMAKGAI